MSNTYFVIGSYYQHQGYHDLLEHLRDTHDACRPWDDYAILSSEQRGSNRKPRGFSATYNQLVRCALSDPECRYIWLLTDDAIPMGDCLGETQDLLASDPTIGACFPVEAWKEEGKFVTMLPVIGTKFPIEDALVIGDPTFEQVFAGFACVCIRRDAFDRVGVMDESLGKGYAEDLDWGIRCWRGGYRIVNYRRAWFRHERGRTFNALTADGLFGKNEPYEAADLAKEKWPWLWSGETFEDTMNRLRGWYEQARSAR
jgi:GT2 family glycosyltransferase